MAKKETLKRARYIFTTGKLIRDRVFRNLTGHVGPEKKNNRFIELSLPQIHAVNVTRERGRVTITELAEVLGVSSPSASAMVDRLVEKRILIREQDPADRRKVAVSVAPQATTTLEKVEETILQSFVELVEKIGPETACKWCEVLKRVKAVQEQENRNIKSTINPGR